MDALQLAAAESQEVVGGGRKLPTTETEYRQVREVLFREQVIESNVKQLSNKKSGPGAFFGFAARSGLGAARC